MKYLQTIWSQAVTRTQKTWSWLIALDPRIKVAVVFAILLTAKLTSMGSAAFVWANIQLFMIAVAGGAGFALGWFCSPAAKAVPPAYRRDHHRRAAELFPVSVHETD
ncbi:MAG: hypothetical protein AAGH57_00615 [Pseudomonadota bacterium]